MTPTNRNSTLNEMNERTREVFRRVVEGYLASGDPVGSRTLTRSMSEPLSAATIRNVMQDLEYLGLLNSPHISAGRIPTELGLRLFVDGLLEIGDAEMADRQRMESAAQSEAGEIATMLDQISETLSGITRGASVVLAPKQESKLRQIDFVSLSPDRALVVLVFADGRVENRLFTPPAGLTQAAMQQAANFLNAHIAGRSLSELRRVIEREMALHRREIDDLASRLVENGLAVWENSGGPGERLIVRGRANLIDDHSAAQDIERIRVLFDDLERKRDIADFLTLSESGEGVRIFIGSENKLFSLSGSTLVVSPYMDADRKIVGAVGVIGPTRLNYGRIVPIVDYTAQLVSRLLSDRGTG